MLCGYPLCQFDHITPYAQVRAHEADNLALLCDKHHRQKTSGLIAVSLIRAARKQPRNLTEECHWMRPDIPREELTLVTPNGAIDISLGKSRIASLGEVLVDAIVAEGEPLLTVDMRDGFPVISAILNSTDGSRLVHIQQNEIITSNEAYDIEWKASRLAIRKTAARKSVDLQIVFGMEEGHVTIGPARFAWTGHLFEITKGGDVELNSRSVTFSGCRLVCGDPAFRYRGITLSEQDGSLRYGLGGMQIIDDLRQSEQS